MSAAWKGRTPRRSHPETPHPLIHILPDQKDIVDKGATMRLGTYKCQLVAGSLAEKLYGASFVYERHRHRYEVNNDYREQLNKLGLRCSGLSPDYRLVEIIEIPEHPFFIATQFHPEFRSRPNRAHPLFSGLIAAADAKLAPPARSCRNQLQRQQRRGEEHAAEQQDAERAVSKATGTKRDWKRTR